MTLVTRHLVLNVTLSAKHFDIAQTLTAFHATFPPVSKRPFFTQVNLNMLLHCNASMYSVTFLIFYRHSYSTSTKLQLR